MRKPETTFINSEMLGEIRAGADWRRVFEALGLRRSKGGNEEDWWASSPFSEDKTPSFHINAKGWYCHSTKQGGGVIELVQAVKGINCYEAGRWLVENGLSSMRIGTSENTDESSLSKPLTPLQRQNISLTREALRDLYPISEADESDYKNHHQDGKDDDINPAATGAALPSLADTAEPLKENKPIRQTLLPALDGEHETLKARGISPETAEYLGCGYLPEPSKSKLINRIVFQIRGLQQSPAADDETLPIEERYKPVILSHIGRATTEEQRKRDKKWQLYGGFHKHLELYNIDKLLLDPDAREQTKEQQRILIVEGCMDVASLIEAKLKNVVATFGSCLLPEQLERLDLIAKETGIRRFLLCYDRDKAGHEGIEKARKLLAAERPDDYQAEVFDWEMRFPSPSRGEVKIPEHITDVGEFTQQQLEWLRERGFL
jgi:DNA primase